MKLFTKFVFGLLLLGNVVSQPCVSFSIASGTGCAWMCQYCADQLGTNNYYFTTQVCTYEPVGCIGTPIAGGSYTCCKA